MIRASRGLMAMMVVLTAASVAGNAEPRNGAGAVFVMTNNAAKNEVIAFERAADGSLSESERYDTGGRGSGGVTDPLEAQGSLTLSQDHSLLFAVNAGSGNISVFSVHHARLTLLNKVPSGGSQPVAVAEHQGFVYVLNAGGAGSVVAFHLDYGGQLRQIRNATQFLSANATGGASISASPDGRFVAVTERLADTIDIFRVQQDGTLSPAVVNANPAPGTFSLSFAPNGKAIVSETGVAGQSDASAVSSYTVQSNGKIAAVSQSVPAFAAANCWNVITPDGKRVYTSNAGSASISGFNIANNGTLTPIGNTVVGHNPDGSTNLDISISADGKYIYTLNSATGTVGEFRIEQDGSLTNLGEAGSFDQSAGFNGIAAL